VQTLRDRARPGAERELKTFRGSDDDLRAMKRALANAPLGPKATLALTSAIIALEEDNTEIVVRSELPAGAGS
jgi:hypothetical protein